VPVPQQSSCPADAVILAAGMGTRLGDRTADRPKCLIEINGVSIVANALQRLEEAGVSETVIVVGYRHEDVQACVGDRVGRMRVTYRRNDEYRTTGTSRSLEIGITDLGADLLVLEGDVFFEPRLLPALISSPHVDATVVEPWHPALDGSVVTVDRDGRVSAWIHKKDRAPGFSLPGTFKTVNIHRLSASLVRTLRPLLRAESDSDGGREPLETVFARIVRDGGRIHALPATGRWVEIDDESDLRTAESLFGAAPHGS